MLENLIKKSGKSKYQIAKESGVPYTTLNELVNNKKNPEECSYKTISKLADYFRISTDDMFREINNTGSSISVVATTWEDARYKQYLFPTVLEHDQVNLFRVHPLKQKLVAKLYDALKEEACIKKIVLFGSSTTIRCNKKSDIDLAIELRKEKCDAQTKNRISEVIQTICDWDADILWLDQIEKNSKIYNNIFNGVVII